MKHVYDFIDEFTSALKDQLIEDEKKWGGTWLECPQRGQEDRIFEEYDVYYEDYMDGEPIPWLKVAGNAMIAWIRVHHPELLEAWVDE